jgi:hypothetical protein
VHRGGAEIENPGVTMAQAKTPKTLTKRAAKQLETAQYIADMLLELRNLARSSGLPTLLGLLEITFCEAFSIANKVVIPEAELEKLRRIIDEANGE